MFPATLFDYNGVLVDDENVHLAAFRDVLGPLGVTLSDGEYWERYLGFDDAGAFAAILGDRGRSSTDEEIAALIQAKRPRYLERAEGSLKGFPGAAEIVRRRALAGPVVIVSGALKDEIELGLSVLGVRDAVQAIVSAEDTRRSKPDPEGYHRGLELLSATLGSGVARRALVIEDSIAGVEAAKAAGLACAAVLHSYPKEALERAGADLTAHSLDALDEGTLGALYDRLGV